MNLKVNFVTLDVTKQIANNMIKKEIQMSYNNYDLAISKIQYLVNGRPHSETIVLNEETTEVGVEITFSGIKYLTNKKQEYFNSISEEKHDVYPNLKVYCTHFTQRSTKDLVIHSFQEVDIKKTDFENDSLVITYSFGEFNKNFKFKDSDYNFKYDMTENILYFNMATIEEGSISGLQMIDDKISHAVHSPFFSLKVPMVTENE